ncbi:hypothetical protein PJF56_04740 [Roseofilum sp. BLCC_M91]|uniref:Novel toxin 11 domain-containing protein n=1 Tax=Roseofilum halophilum BLCC-M91 TaxID=3022259 RepID=A0ABT7BG69_9CYAN|nr:hypothetical protein [Roseofilum halophilum]MDJ1178165.1 hypothetical protein [Roseofilum halophilum BLCC-M91]
MSPRRRQTKTRISRRRETSENASPQFAAPPVIQPKIQRKIEWELPEWKPRSNSKSSPLQRLQPSAALQAKLEIGQPNDPYEQQANTVAHNVVKQINSPVSNDAQQHPTVQRQTKESNLPLRLKPKRQVIQGLPNVLGTPVLQMKPYTVKEQAHVKNRNFENIHSLTQKTDYQPGEVVEISDNPEHHITDPAGNNRWYRIKGSPDNHPRYIRATRLQLYGTYVSNSQRVRENNKALQSQQENIAKIQALIAVAKRSYKDKKGKEQHEQMSLAKQIDLGKGFLPNDMVNAIQELSNIPEGKTYLSQNGLLTQQEVEQVATEKRVVGDWERVQEHDYLKVVNSISPIPIPVVRGEAVLSPVHRLQIATYQRDKVVNDNDEQFLQTPGYLRYEANAMKQAKSEYEQALKDDPQEEKPETKAKREVYEKFKNDIYNKDTQMWENTLSNNTENASESVRQKYQQQNESAIKILQRVFLLLHHGLKYRENQDVTDFKQWEENVAVALSHGGRVMINLPPVETDNPERVNEFIHWLLGASGNTHKPRAYQDITEGSEESKSDHYKAQVDTRMFSSHNVKVTENSLTEEKGNTADVKGKFHMSSTLKHYGMDIPLGGLGNEDLSGDVILPDGRHGHMYIYYRPPTIQLPGSVLIGTETSRMAKTDVFGMYHDSRGAPAEFSSTGTSKGGRIGGEFGGRVIDYTQLTEDGKGLTVKDPNWLQQLKEAEQNIYEGQITAAELVGKTTPELKDKLFGENRDRSNTIGHKPETE